MTDNSNAITELISKTAGGVITRDAALQALYEAVVAALPEKDLVSEPEGTARKAVQIGYNLATDQARRSLANLFGVEDVGNLDKPEATNNQPQLADNRYDANRLGTYIFVGDNDRLKNLGDLYWSYVSEEMARNNGNRPYTRKATPKSELEYLQKNMEFASFNQVGLWLGLARADQHAKERLARVSDMLVSNPNTSKELPTDAHNPAGISKEGATK